MTHDQLQIDSRADLADERGEWVASVDAMIAARGRDAAARILDEVIAHARAQGVGATGRTPYRNTIPAHRVPPYPGDEAVEERINAYLRWNAMAMVVRANKRHPGIGATCPRTPRP